MKCIGIHKNILKNIKKIYKYEEITKEDELFIHLNVGKIYAMLDFIQKV